ncbi:MAG: ribonuclease P protein component [Mailhella sp.]|nr:ribonuclease P protein component [Mailhella sp.]
MSLTWPRERRITRRAEYTACYDGGERRHTKYFIVFARSSGMAGNGRLGLAVTKKCGNAVARNRIKRVLRSFFRLHQHEMPCMDIVVTPKKHLRADKFCLALAETELLPLLGELSASVSAEHLAVSPSGDAA